MLNEAALAHQSNLVTHPHRFFRIVGHDDAGRTCFPDNREGLIAHAIAQALV